MRIRIRIHNTEKINLKIVQLTGKKWTTATVYIYPCCFSNFVYNKIHEQELREASMREVTILKSHDTDWEPSAALSMFI